MTPVGYIPLDVTSGTFNGTTNLYSLPGMWETWVFRAKFTLQSGKFGFGLNGLLPSGNRNIGIYIDASTQKITLEYYDKSNVSFYRWKTANFTYNATHTYSIQLRASRRYLSAFFKNETTGEYATMSWSPTTQNLLLMPVGYIALLNPVAGSQITLSSASFFVEDSSTPSVVFIGDSITIGAWLDQGSLTYPMKYAQIHNILDMVVCGSSNLNHACWAQSMTAFLNSYHPAKVFIMMGDNDETADPSTWMPTRISITDSLAPAQVVQLQLTPEKVYDNTAANAAILAAYPNAIDIRSTLYASGSTTLGDPTNYIDNVHLNRTGHNKIAALLP